MGAFVTGEGNFRKSMFNKQTKIKCKCVFDRVRKRER